MPSGSKRLKVVGLTVVATMLPLTILDVAPYAKTTPSPADVPETVALVSATPLIEFRKSRAFRLADAVPIVRQGRLARVDVRHLSSMPSMTLVIIEESGQLVAGTPVLVAELR